MFAKLKTRKINEVLNTRFLRCRLHARFHHTNTYDMIHIFRYQREIANCETAARNLCAEEERMDREANEKAEQAERLEREARALDEEAARLERDARQGGW